MNRTEVNSDFLLEFDALCDKFKISPLYDWDSNGQLIVYMGIRLKDDSENYEVMNEEDY
jgi:hypothetical protein